MKIALIDEFGNVKIIDNIHPHDMHADLLMDNCTPCSWCGTVVLYSESDKSDSDEVICKPCNMTGKEK